MFQLRLVLLSFIVSQVLSGSVSSQPKKNNDRIDQRNLRNPLDEDKVQSVSSQDENLKYSEIVNNQRKLFSWAGAFKCKSHPEYFFRYIFA